MEGRVVSALLPLLALWASGSARAADRVWRMLEVEDGLPVHEVGALAQDATGYLWIGAGTEVVRWDGHRVERLTHGELRGIVRDVAFGPGGEPLALIDRGEVFALGEAGVRPFIGPEGAPLQRTSDLLTDDQGRLWVAREGELWLLDATGVWTSPSAGHPSLHGAVRRVCPAPGDAVLATGPQGVWRIGDAVERLTSHEAPWGAAVGPDDGVWIPGWSTLMEVRGEEVLTHTGPGDRPLSVLVRGGTTWASWGKGVAAARSGAAPELLGPDQGVHSGGPMLVDREGSLWLGTFLGLVQLPWPDVVTWTREDGLPSDHTRFLARTGSRVWVSTWHGLGWIDHGPTGTLAGTETETLGKGPICVDSQGIGWMAATWGPDPEHITGGGILALREDGHERYPSDDTQSWNAGCAAATDGGVWIARDSGLYRVPPGGPPVRVGDVPGQDQRGRHAVLQDSEGGLWVATDREMCRIDPSELASGVPWSCAELDVGNAVDLVETGAGSIWLVSRMDGVYRWDGTDWDRLPAADALSSPWIIGLRRSPDGTVWVMGQGGGTRVRDDPGSEQGWVVVEHLSPAVDSAVAGLSDLLEDSDGTRWMASLAGVTRAGQGSREQVAEPPRVVLVEAHLDGRRVDPTAPLVLAGPGADLELVFAALSFRSPGRIRYRLRLRPGDPWSTPSRERTLRLADLRPGRYDIEVQASSDGRAWSAAPARVEVEVPPPWYLRPWFIVAVVAALAGGLAAAWRIHLAMALRVERLRTRIAMDLHDEVGSGLGSIGLLAGLLRSGGLEPEPGQEIAGRIADTAADLSSSMRGIVWSLRPGSDRLDRLVTHLVDRASGLFPGDEVVFEARLPDPVPPAPLSLDTLRAVQLIATEALHNAARHAHASRVELGLERQGRRWCLWVADDGDGLVEGQGSDGLGQESMRRRAAADGAHLEWVPTPGGGTTVRVVFDARSA